MSFGRATAPQQTERRGAPRTQLSCAARLRTCFGLSEGTLSDLSVTGARFRVQNPPKEGTTALLEWEGGDVLCRVVWTYNDTCGVVFDDPISRQVVDKAARTPSSDEPTAEVGKIPLGRRSSLRAVLVNRAGENGEGAA